MTLALARLELNLLGLGRLELSSKLSIIEQFSSCRAKLLTSIKLFIASGIGEMPLEIITEFYSFK